MIFYCIICLIEEYGVQLMLSEVKIIIDVISQSIIGEIKILEVSDLFSVLSKEKKN